VGAAYVGKVLSAASVTPPANGTDYQVNEPIFITATVTFQRVDRDGDTVPDKYFAFRPDPFNVFVKVENGLQVVAAHRILEAPAVHIPVDLVEIPGGTAPCPNGMTTVATGCAISTVVEVTQSRTDFVPGTLTVTPTYFNFIRDPELNATPPVNPGDPALCVTEEDGCYLNLWLGLAPGPSTTVLVSGGDAPPLVAPLVGVSPATWDLSWEPVASSGVVDLYVGNLPGGLTVTQIQAAQVRLNGAVLPVFTEVLASSAGFTGPVLHLQYNRTQAMTSLRTLASRQFLPAGDQAPLLLSGLLTSDGNAGPAVAVFRATPLVLLRDLSGPVLTTPAPITVNATSPAGALVPYTATATDPFDPAPTLSCVPPSGSTFPIGLTTVSCTATDLATNSTLKTFTVTVLVDVSTAVTQMNALIAQVNGLSGVPSATKNSLVVKLNAAKAFLAQGNRIGACGKLTDFITEVNSQSGKKLTVAQANSLRTAAQAIKTTLLCP
jgi:hypothetical protein